MKLDLKAFSKSFDFGDGRTVSVETGKIARQAHGAVLVRMGDAVLLCTVVSNYEAKEGAGFFPLSVDYQEKFAGAGRIPGGFFKREGRASEHEVLICRLVDRAIRPLFPKGYMNETQIIIGLISSDPDVQPDALAAFATSAALTISDIPFAGPISEVRVGRINGELIANPSTTQLVDADLNIIVGATEADVTMVEGEMHEVSEKELVDAIKFGHNVIKKQCQFLNAFRDECGTAKEKRAVEIPVLDPEMQKRVSDACRAKILEVARGGHGKPERKAGFGAVKEEFIASLGEEPDPDEKASAKEALYQLEKEVIRDMVLTDRKRLDGRATDEVRGLAMEIDLLPSPHGVALFTRGETQSLTTVTLGTKKDEQMLDKAGGVEWRNFMLHYNFPPFCTGEAKFLRGVSRREQGHGNLAMRSIKQVLPEDENNPYTIRVVSDIMESNGSSSMATVCAASLALMDAGIPITRGVSGIAMGMIKEGDRVAILSDILGDEDHLGDMDFKVTGTEKGIVACQMDIKIDGLPYELLEQALVQAKAGRSHILTEMNKVIEAPKSDYKPHAPRIIKMFVDKEFIGPIIGPGGKHIQELQADTGTTISIEEVEIDGRTKGQVLIAGTNLEGVATAQKRIQSIAATAEVGDEYESTVKTIMPYGAFVEFMPGKEGLLHISEISWSRLETMDDVFKPGDKVKVKLVGIDARSGKYKLSRKVLLPNPKDKKEDA